MNTATFHKVVTDLKRQGHKPKWIAYVLKNRTSIRRNILGELLEMNPTELVHALRDTGNLLALSQTQAIDAHNKCNAAFELLSDGMMARKDTEALDLDAPIGSMTLRHLIRQLDLYRKRLKEAHA